MRKLTKAQDKEYRQRLGFLVAKRERGEALTKEEKGEYSERMRILSDSDSVMDHKGKPEEI